MQRRQPRPVVWPARLLWLPLVAAGLALVVQVDVDRVQAGTWRLLVSIPGPAQLAQPSRWGGLGLLLAGWAAFGFQGARVPRLRAAAYMRLALAGWVFLAVAVLATWRLDAFVAEAQQGLDWRFLAHLRTTWLDRVLLGVSLAAGVACWLLSWGTWPTEGGGRQQRADDQQDPSGPAA